MKLVKIMAIGLLFGLATLNSLAQEAAPPATPVQIDAQSPLIQMAILLDTSNSMDGLIDQAKAQLWSIVNEYAIARQHGKAPRLELALYEYGNDGLKSETGYIRQVLSLTDDLDKVSEQLFALKTNGGQEYCGWVIERAVADLAWSKNTNDYKVIFIAGNEPFTQGKVDYKKSCKAAIEKGVIVNTIHCGDYETGVKQSWSDGAKLADGGYLHIDQNRKAVYVAAPQDEAIVRLGTELNSTYLAYGRWAEEGVQLQIAQDSNAKLASSSAPIQRSISKSTSNYDNSRWDIVDAIENKNLELAELKKEDLPDAMKDMTLEEREAYVKEMGEKRQTIQKQISQLNVERQKFVAEEMKKLADKGEDTLEAVIIKLVRQQAARFHFEFIQPQTDPAADNAPVQEASPATEKK